MKFGVIQTGGKQIRVQVDEVIRVERLKAIPGTTVEFDHVLMVAEQDNILIGAPIVAAAKVTAEVVSHERDVKIIVFKKKRRKNYRRKKGHRQRQTVVRITSINVTQEIPLSDHGT